MAIDFILTDRILRISYALYSGRTRGGDGVRAAIADNTAPGRMKIFYIHTLKKLEWYGWNEAGHMWVHKQPISMDEYLKHLLVFLIQEEANEATGRYKPRETTVVTTAAPRAPTG